MLIRPTALVLKQIFFWNLLVVARLVGLISIKTKEYFIWPPLWKRSIWWQMFNFVLLSQRRWFQLNSRIVITHFASVMTLNNGEIIAETRSYIFRWRFRSHRRRLCLSSLLSLKPSKGLLQLAITWYKIRHAGGQAHYYSRTGTLKQRDLNQWSLTCLCFDVPVLE